MSSSRAHKLLGIFRKQNNDSSPSSASSQKTVIFLMGSEIIGGPPTNIALAFSGFTQAEQDELGVGISSLATTDNPNIEFPRMNAISDFNHLRRRAIGGVLLDTDSGDEEISKDRAEWENAWSKYTKEAIERYLAERGLADIGVMTAHEANSMAREGLKPSMAVWLSSYRDGTFAAGRGSETETDIKSVEACSEAD